MLLIRRLKHVNYNYLFSTMEQSFVTGLKLKNNLTSQLVLSNLSRKNLSLPTPTTSGGIHVDLLFIRIATWDMQGKTCFTQKLPL